MAGSARQTGTIALPLIGCDIHSQTFAQGLACIDAIAHEPAFRVRSIEASGPVGTAAQIDSIPRSAPAPSHPRGRASLAVPTATTAKGTPPHPR